MEKEKKAESFETVHTRILKERGKYMLKEDRCNNRNNFNCISCHNCGTFNFSRNKQYIEKCSNTSTLPIYCISFVISLLFTKQVLLSLMRFFFHFLVHKFYLL